MTIASFSTRTIGIAVADAKRLAYARVVSDSSTAPSLGEQQAIIRHLEGCIMDPKSIFVSLVSR